MNRKTSDMKSFWQHLDGIAVVNLDDRPDRWEKVCADAALHLHDAPALTRISAVYGARLPGFGSRPWFRGKSSDKRWAARAGCTQSHRKVMDYANSKGWQTFLVLEDDADFTPLAAADLGALEQALFADHADWDFCYLGFSKAVGTSFALASFGNHVCAEISGCYTTHAYIVRTRARDWILGQLADDNRVWSWLAKNRIIDRWYIRHLSRALTVYAISPSIISQAVGFSDIVGGEVNYKDQFPEAITSYAKNRYEFWIRQKICHASFIMGNFYDTFRGLLKRLKGF